MADIDTTVETIEAFEAQLEAMFDWCKEQDAPLKISASYGSAEDDQKGTILYGCYRQKYSPLNALRTSFKIGRTIFGHSARMNQRLLDAGCVVDNDYVRDATHVLEIAHGVWAETKLPVWHDYKVKMDDIDAMLSAIKHGARLRKI